MTLNKKQHMVCWLIRFYLSETLQMFLTVYVFVHIYVSLYAYISILQILYNIYNTLYIGFSNSSYHNQLLMWVFMKPANWKVISIITVWLRWTVFGIPWPLWFAVVVLLVFSCLELDNINALLRSYLSSKELWELRHDFLLCAGELTTVMSLEKFTVVNHC